MCECDVMFYMRLPTVSVTTLITSNQIVICKLTHQVFYKIWKHGMMLHMFSNSAESNKLKETVNLCESRLDSIEAKIGKQEEPAIP